MSPQKRCAAEEASGPGQRLGQRACLSCVGTRDRGCAGHDQLNKCHRQPSHPKFGQVCVECRLAIFRQDLQGLPDFQKEVPVLPGQLPYAVEGAGAAVPGDVPTRQCRGAYQKGGVHGDDLHEAGCDCAAKAIFYCHTMNSHRPRSQNTSKEQALIPEKESRRT